MTAIWLSISYGQAFSLGTGTPPGAESGSLSQVCQTDPGTVGGSHPAGCSNSFQIRDRCNAAVTGDVGDHIDVVTHSDCQPADRRKTPLLRGGGTTSGDAGIAFVERAFRRDGNVDDTGRLSTQATSNPGKFHGMNDILASALGCLPPEPAHAGECHPTPSPACTSREGRGECCTHVQALRARRETVKAGSALPCRANIQTLCSGRKPHPLPFECPGWFPDS